MSHELLLTQLTSQPACLAGAALCGGSFCCSHLSCRPKTPPKREMAAMKIAATELMATELILTEVSKAPLSLSLSYSCPSLLSDSSPSSLSLSLCDFSSLSLSFSLFPLIPLRLSLSLSLPHQIPSFHPYARLSCPEHEGRFPLTLTAGSGGSAADTDRAEPELVGGPIRQGRPLPPGSGTCERVQRPPKTLPIRMKFTVALDLLGCTFIKLRSPFSDCLYISW